MSKRCIVITTINKPSEQILYYTSIKSWDLIVIGDYKTDDNLYGKIKCIYLGLKEQYEMFPSLYSKVPLNSYTRKMFGYLYAIKHNYNVIYDTDDDNKYSGNLDMFNSTDNVCIKTTINTGFVNIYKNYTEQNIWPRGIPPLHQSIDITPELTIENKHLEISIIQGVVNNDPDVDAYYRININNKSFDFEKSNININLNKYSVCPFNSQNTFWIDKSMFFLLYLPVTVSFRYTDILRSFVSLFQLWKHNKTIQFTGPTAVQLRNEHDLNKDYQSELTMYETAEKVIQLLNNSKDANIIEMYQILQENGIVDKTELDTLKEWIKLI